MSLLFPRLCFPVCTGCWRPLSVLAVSLGVVPHMSPFFSCWGFLVFVVPPKVQLPLARLACFRGHCRFTRVVTVWFSDLSGGGSGRGVPVRTSDPQRCGAAPAAPIDSPLVHRAALPDSPVSITSILIATTRCKGCCRLASFVLVLLWLLVRVPRNTRLPCLFTSDAAFASYRLCLAGIRPLLASGRECLAPSLCFCSPSVFVPCPRWNDPLPCFFFA